MVIDIVSDRSIESFICMATVVHVFINKISKVRKKNIEYTYKLGHLTISDHAHLNSIDNNCISFNIIFSSHIQITIFYLNIKMFSPSFHLNPNFL